ncbi:hypothetical protein EXIGLDRAFT_775659 [Exidia glandulosa HHB12029]|uniref:ZZ-type domain-containing protein n=1 Tax=Exidia glandulosa HHB12029 TaxID=1314781 RepID=A0A165DU82_EXIGL|nr:hypothetical protein EXIGLDRAFT_775659 [Exidia glandulosa HHB12029]
MTTPSDVADGMVTLTVEQAEVFEKDYAPPPPVPPKSDGMLTTAVSRISTANTFYQENQGPVDSALQAIAGLASHELTKTAASQVLNAAEKLVTGLGFVAKLHPFAQPVVEIFKGLIVLEIKRHENDKRVARLVLFMSTMMVEFLQYVAVADVVFLSTPVLDRLNRLPPDESVKLHDRVFAPGPMQTVLAKVPVKIKDCGNAIDKYYKTNRAAKYLLSPHYEDKFKSLAEEFNDLKSEVNDALQVRTALRVEDTHHLVSVLMAQVATLSGQISDMKELFKPQTREEKRIDAADLKLGGRELCLKSNKSISELLAIDAANESFGADSTPSGEYKPSQAILKELRTPLEKQLEENRASFEASFSLQMHELKDLVEERTNQIIFTLQDRAYNRVDDKHLQYVWKGMDWPLCVQTGLFIAGLHDYFTERLSSSAPLMSALPVTAPSSPTNTSAASHPGKFRAPDVDQSDSWCLEYLDVFYVPALKEAFDSDSNGLVNIREVNHYTQSHAMPKDWGVLRRLAFSAVGWHVEMLRYREKIQALLNTIVEMVNDVLPVNRGTVRDAVEPGFDTVTSLVMGLDDYTVVSDPKVEDLVTVHMSYYEQRLRDKLQIVHYQITSVDYVPLLFKDSPEQYLLPVIYLHLERLLKILRLAQTHTLDRSELLPDTASLLNVLATAEARVSQLRESFSQQAFSPDTKMQSFAKGLYKFFPAPPAKLQYAFCSYFDQTVEDEIRNDASEGLRCAEPDPRATAYGAAPALDTSDLRGIVRFRAIKQAVIAEIDANSWISLTDRGQRILTFTRLGVLDALERISWTDTKFLSEAEKAELAVLMEGMNERDLVFCRERADLTLRETLRVHYNSCNGCDKSPIVGTRYDCIDCGDKLDYQLCEHCIEKKTTALLSDSDTKHTDAHNMVAFPTEIVMQRSNHYVFKAREMLPGRIPLITSNEKDIQCCECGDEVGECFYFCLKCPEIKIDLKCFLCERCSRLESFATVAEHKSGHGHILALIRSRNAPSVTGLPPDSDNEEKADSASQEHVRQLHDRMEKMDARLDIIVQRLEALTASIQMVFTI